jgi:hypothetical protein
LNEVTQAAINLWSPCPISGFPTPEDFEASAMPTKDGLRLNHLGHTKQPRPNPGHPYEKCAIAVAQSKTRRRPPQCNGKLMAEKQILGLKPQPRLEEVGDEHSDRVQDRKHRSK